MPSIEIIELGLPILFTIKGITKQYYFSHYFVKELQTLYHSSNDYVSMIFHIWIAHQIDKLKC